MVLVREEVLDAITTEAGEVIQEITPADGALTPWNKQAQTRPAETHFEHFLHRNIVNPFVAPNRSAMVPLYHKTGATWSGCCGSPGASWPEGSGVTECECPPASPPHLLEMR